MKIKSLFLACAVCAISINANAQDLGEFIFVNGNIFTATSKSAQAIWVKDGIIKYVGNKKTAMRQSKKAQIIDLHGNTLMPGIVDGHMHPQSGGLKASMCSLQYAPMTIAQMNAKIQKCLDEKPNAKDDDWLVVVDWFEQEMQPIGIVPNFKDMDTIQTKRPIYIRNSYGHAGLINRNGMKQIDLWHQKERAGGIIVRDKDGNPTGRLEDSAVNIVEEKIQPPDAQTNLIAAKKAVKLMNYQGITTIFDAHTDNDTMTAYRSLQQSGELTLRPHFAVLIDLDKQPDISKSIDEVVTARKEYDQGKPKVTPSLSVHSAKIFLDGVVTFPSMTGALIEPYFENRGTKEKPNWVQDKNYGIKPYLSLSNLSEIMVRLADLGIDTHMHADADGAVRLALDASQKMRELRPKSKARPAIAHAEMVDPKDYKRFGKLDVTPLLSFQWERPAADTWEGSIDILGPKRFGEYEPASQLVENGTRIAFGSDWPVDPLNEWLALQIGVTRMALPEDRARYPKQLGNAKPLDLTTALKAMTINSAYSLHMDKYIGTIETGKFADLIVLDRNLFKTPKDEISKTKVVMTMVGGKIVYRQDWD